jgi:hypothetical protein
MYFKKLFRDHIPWETRSADIDADQINVTKELQLGTNPNKSRAMEKCMHYII